MELARRVEGVTYEEIASILNISESTARLDCGTLSRQGYIALKNTADTRSRGHRMGRKACLASKARLKRKPGS